MSGINGTFRSYWGAVAVPILDKGDGSISNVTHDWSNAMAALSGGLAVTIMRLSIRNYRVDIAKERLAEMAIANGCQFILFVDDDTIPPPDALLKMVRRWKIDPKYQVQTGVYWSKSDPPHPLLFKGNLEGSYWNWNTQDLVEVDGAGAGCLFVDTNVFKKLSKPWFSCDYFFDDPRTMYDLEKWHLADTLGEELLKPQPNKEFVSHLEQKLQETGDKIRLAAAGQFDPNLLKNKHQDGNTTEDLYFFKKVKEELGLSLWADCSIQCYHQDKATGRMWGLQPDMPQSKPRYEGRLQPGDKVVLDIGAGVSNYWLEDGEPIKVDNDPSTNPDILCDARSLPVEDCFADIVVSSHMLEHFSFRETLAALREWVRVLKIGGELRLVVPNLRWASKRVLEDAKSHPDDAERAMFMYHSAQKGDLKSAQLDIHKAGFTPASLGGILSRVGGLGDIMIDTSEGNLGNWEEHRHNGPDGYNIIAIAKKIKHNSAVSLKLPLQMQEEAKSFIGDTAKPTIKTNAVGKLKGHNIEITNNIIGKVKEKPEKKIEKTTIVSKKPLAVQQKSAAEAKIISKVQIGA